MKYAVAAQFALDDHLNSRLEDIGNRALVGYGERAAAVGGGEASHKRRRISLNRSRVDDAAHPNRALSSRGSTGIELRHSQIVDGRRLGHGKGQICQAGEDQNSGYEKAALPAPSLAL